MNRQAPLLITVALKVHAKHTVLTSQQERELLYMESCLRWLTETSLTHFIFCDNSHALTDTFMLPLKQKADALNKTIEFLQFDGSHNLIKKKGKGFGEGELIKYALQNSKFLKESSGFYKITGKLFVENFNALHLKMNLSQNYMRRDTAKMEGSIAIDSRFFYMQKEFYEKNISDLYKQVDDDNGVYIERLIYQKLLPLQAVENFPQLPMITGVSGSTGQNYTQEKWITTFRRRLFFKLGQYKI